ncbi:valine--tRNA ligase, partial [Coemansia furcata]
MNQDRNAAKRKAKMEKFLAKQAAGEKRDMSEPMACSYDPVAVETDSEGENNPKGRFVMVTLPPNVTGKLNIGHPMFVAIQDLIVRWNRMRGVTTLFVPDCDHAGISTQVVVEKLIWKNEQLTRHDLGREAF